MRLRTGLVLLAVVVVLIGGAAAGLTGVFSSGASGDLSVRWVSDTSQPNMGGNHHAPAAAQVGNGGMVFAPVSGNGAGCALVAIDAANGSTVWEDRVPPANCTIHSVADPVVSDYDSDGKREVLATTTENVVIAYEPRTGTEELRHDLTNYGYTQPIVTDLVGNSTKEVIVVDVDGTVLVLEPDGTEVWTRRLSSQTNAQPAVADFDADGTLELAVGLVGDGNLTLFEGNGTQRWSLDAPFDSSIAWMTVGETDDDDPATEIVVATTGGTVAAVDGESGEIEWRRDLGDLAAVHAIGDGDRDGDIEVYAVAEDGRLRSLDARDGTIEWEVALTSADVQMTPPPSLGDVDGDGTPEIVAVTNDGLVSVVDPASGELLATYEREGEVPIYTHPTLADTDGDAVDEIYVIYGDGRVVSLAYHEEQ